MPQYWWRFLKIIHGTDNTTWFAQMPVEFTFRRQYSSSYKHVSTLKEKHDVTAGQLVIAVTSTNSDAVWVWHLRELRRILVDMRSPELEHHAVSFQLLSLHETKSLECTRRNQNTATASLVTSAIKWCPPQPSSRHNRQRKAHNVARSDIHCKSFHTPKA